MRAYFQVSVGAATALLLPPHSTIIWHRNLPLRKKHVMDMLIMLVRIILILPQIVRAASTANHCLMRAKRIVMKICTMTVIALICSANCLAANSSLD
jgi:hypothetical protein